VKILALLIGLIWLSATLAADIVVEDVIVRHLNVKPGASAPVEAVLLNKGADKAEAVLVAVDRWGLDREKEVNRQPVTLAGGERRSITFEFTPTAEEFGHELECAVIVNNGRSSSKKTDMYTVTTNPYRSCVWNPSTFGNAFPRDGARAEFGEKLRRQKCGVVEVFSPWTGMWAEMNPKDERWFSGQGAYPETVESIKAVIDSCHRAGVAVTVYYTPLAFGPVGAEWLREHPEWNAFNASGRPMMYFDVRKMEMYHSLPWPKTAGEAWGDTAKIRDAFGGGVFLTDKRCFQFGLEQLAAAATRLKFDGVRWDGQPMIADWTYSFLSLGSLNYRIDGKSFKQLVPDTDAYSAWMLQECRRTMKKTNPSFIWGYNWSPESQGDMSKLTPATWAVQSDDSMQLDESLVLTSETRGGKTSDPAWLWEPYIDRVRKSVERLRGTTAIHTTVINTMDNAIYNRHVTTILYASGSRCYGGWFAHPWPDDIMRFALRNSELLYGNGIKPMKEAGNRVAVEASSPVWWKKFCFERSLDGNKKSQYIIQLLNPPVKAYRDAKETALPAPVERVTMTFKTRPGWRLTRCVTKDVEDGMASPEPTRTQQGDYRVEIGGLKTWRIIVAEWEMEN
jgi:hypothetical protein